MSKEYEFETWFPDMGEEKINAYYVWVDTDSHYDAAVEGCRLRHKEGVADMNGFHSVMVKESPIGEPVEINVNFKMEVVANG